MDNLVFILWVLFFPFFTALRDVIEYKYGKRIDSSANVDALASIIRLSIWGGVGSLLYIPT